MEGMNLYSNVLIRPSIYGRTRAVNWMQLDNVPVHPRVLQWSLIRGREGTRKIWIIRNSGTAENSPFIIPPSDNITLSEQLTATEAVIAIVRDTDFSPNNAPAAISFVASDPEAGKDLDYSLIFLLSSKTCERNCLLFSSSMVLKSGQSSVPTAWFIAADNSYEPKLLLRSDLFDTIHSKASFQWRTSKILYQTEIDSSLDFKRSSGVQLAPNST